MPMLQRINKEEKEERERKERKRQDEEAESKRRTAASKSELEALFRARYKNCSPALIEAIRPREETKGIGRDRMWAIENKLRAIEGLDPTAEGRIASVAKAMEAKEIPDVIGKRYLEEARKKAATAKPKGNW